MKVVERKDQMWYSSEKPTTAVVRSAVSGDENKTWGNYISSGKIEQRHTSISSLEKPISWISTKLQRKRCTKRSERILKVANSSRA